MNCFHSKDKRHEPLYRDFKNIRLVQEAMFASTNEVRGTSYSSRIKILNINLLVKLEHHKLKE